MKECLLFLVFLASLFLPSFAIPEGNDYFSPGRIYEFAEYLYQEEDYLRAAAEFQRYLIFAGESADTTPLLLKIGRCLRLGKKPEKAISYFQRVVKGDSVKEYKDDAIYQIALSYLEMGEYTQAIDHINRSKAHSPQYQKSLTNLLAVSHLYMKNWEEAYKVLSFHRLKPSTLPDFSLETQLERIAQDGMHLPRKKELIACLMSAIIPGTGKMYAGRFRDGLFSLLTIGIASWQACEGFKKDKLSSTRGWIYGALGSLLYLGNIYGSAVSVKLYNENLENDLLRRLDVIVETHLQ
jgi:hypothetical protein